MDFHSAKDLHSVNDAAGVHFIWLYNIYYHTFCAFLMPVLIDDTFNTLSTKFYAEIFNICPEPHSIHRSCHIL